jgi:hypothetical protein
MRQQQQAHQMRAAKSTESTAMVAMAREVVGPRLTVICVCSAALAMYILRSAHQFQRTKAAVAKLV